MKRECILHDSNPIIKYYLLSFVSVGPMMYAIVEDQQTHMLNAIDISKLRMID